MINTTTVNQQNQIRTYQIGDLILDQRTGEIGLVYDIKSVQSIQFDPMVSTEVWALWFCENISYQAYIASESFPLGELHYKLVNLDEQQ